MKNKPDDRWQCEVHANGLVKVETKTKVIAEIPSRDIKIGTLVAAATDLLDALDSMLLLYEYPNAGSRIEAASKARAALEKAKGGAK